MKRVKFIEQYAGPWAMLPALLEGLVAKVQGLDLQAHMEAFKTQASLLGEDDNGGKAPLTITADGVAVLEISGTLTKYSSSLAQGPAMVAVKDQVRSLAQNAKVKGVMLQIDSGGGTVAGTEELAAEIRAIGVPTLARIEDAGCSGAYWLACACDVISANTTATVGSIGVMGVLYDTSAQAAKQGVKVNLVKSGEAKGIGTPGTAVSEKDLAESQRVVNQTHGIFVDTVAAGRGMTRAQAEAVADGRVHIGANAQKLGLVDAVETGSEAYARMLGMIKAGKGNRETVKQPGAAGGGRVPALAAHLTKEVSMETQVNAPGAPGGAAVPAVAAAATLKELKAQFPKASAEFREKCLEEGMTMVEASQAYAEELQAKLEASEAKVTELSQAKRPIGAKPVTGGKQVRTGTVASEGGGLTGKQLINARVQELVAAGKPRTQAWKQACSENPEARLALVESHNRHNGRARAADKFVAEFDAPAAGDDDA